MQQDTSPAPVSFRYMQLADNLENQIRSGTYRPGEKLPSIRHLHYHTGLSISTVYQAYIELEKRGLVDPRQKSGYFVKPLLADILPVPKVPGRQLGPNKITINNLAFALCESMGQPDVLQLGGALIARELLPGREMAGLLKTFPADRMAEIMAVYDHYQGYGPLRRHLAQRSDHLFDHASAEDIVVTNGCMDAVTLCLQAVTRPGDTVLVESPTFPWFLQVIEDLNLYALEIPADPQQGINLKDLRQALERYDVKACLLIPSFNNPLGFLMSDANKQELVGMLSKRNIPIIEDDIYGELHFGPSRPVPFKAFDRKGLVLYCSSFSKTLSPGLRVGWALPGRFLERARRLKLNRDISHTPLTQLVISEFIKNGSFDRHLRRLRTKLKYQVSNTALTIARNFPAGTKISAPQGGLTLWVQMGEKVDSLELFRRALKEKIAVMPGVIFSSGKTYRNCIRISCGLSWSKRLDSGIKILAAIAGELSR